MADITVTAVDVRKLSGQSDRKAAGGSGNVGDLVYIASDGDAEQADADVAASAQSYGVVVSAPNGKLTFVAGDVLDVATIGARVTGFSSLTPGQLLYASVTAGKIADAAPGAASGDFKWIAARAITATTIEILGFTDDFAAQ